MLGWRANNLRFSQVGIINLDALALSDRIPRQRNEAFLRQGAQKLLLLGVGLRRRLVSEGNQDSRIGPAAFLGDIQIGGDEKSRLAFKDDLLDAVLRTLDRSDHSGIQRRSFRQSADGLEDSRPNFSPTPSG